MNNNTHSYAPYSVNPSNLYERGATFYRALREKFPDLPILLAYTGYSGSSLAVAILMAAGIVGDNMISGCYIRKPNESSHGSPVEFNPAWIWAHRKKVYLVVVDDTIASGRTMRWTVDSVRKNIPKQILYLCGEGLFADETPFPLYSVMLDAFGEMYSSVQSGLPEGFQLLFRNTDDYEKEIREWSS